MSTVEIQIEQLLSAAQNPHVLVVDDDARLRDLLSRFLSENGFLVTTASDAVDARQKLTCIHCDLIVLDVMMPGEDGMTLARSLRQSRLPTPILLLTAMGETRSRIEGLEAGADDYMVKPFDPRELLLRMQAILRRAGSAHADKNILRLGNWALDIARGELTDGNERIALTTVEHTLLKALAAKKGEVVSREELARLCDMDAAERTIDVQITRLRRKIEDDPKLPRYVQTVRGKGYILWADEW